MLEEIVRHKRQEVAKRERERSLPQLREMLLAADPVRTVAFDGRVSLIAEVKRRSPSVGDLVSSYDPIDRALAYQRGGAAAISVLTDARFFGGSLDDLTAVRRAVEIPVLRKDFILTPYQVVESRAHGADLVLLIVAALDDRDLIELQELAGRLGMTPLVEVHDQHDLARAVAAGAKLIGINNRDLSDLSVDLLTTDYLAPLVPDDAVAVSESGIATRSDVERVVRAGARAVLVGETLMRSDDPAATIRELLA